MAATRWLQVPLAKWWGVDIRSIILCGFIFRCGNNDKINTWMDRWKKHFFHRICKYLIRCSWSCFFQRWCWVNSSEIKLHVQEWFHRQKLPLLEWKIHGVVYKAIPRLPIKPRIEAWRVSVFLSVMVVTCNWRDPWPLDVIWKDLTHLQAFTNHIN